VKLIGSKNDVDPHNIAISTSETEAARCFTDVSQLQKLKASYIAIYPPYLVHCYGTSKVENNRRCVRF